MPPKMTGARMLWESLLREGVEVVFGYPGGSIMPVYDAMLDYPVRHVLTRHEQGAAHAADAYARTLREQRKVGVAMATSGPGATNLVTGIATAFMDSSPVVFITGQVAAEYLGTDAFQETDVTGVTMPITKHNFLVTQAAEIPRVVREAFHIARTGRPGPVLIDLCKNAQNDEAEFVWPEQVRLPGYRPPERADPDALARANALLRQAQRPVILAGQGVLISGAMAQLQALAETAHIPVAMTLLGLGALPLTHPLALGMMGMHGEYFVNMAIQHADLLIALGMRFDDRVTGKLEAYAPQARKIHVEVDPAEINKNVPVDVALLGDLRTVLEQWLEVVEPQRHDAWLTQIEAWRADTRRRDVVEKVKRNGGGPLRGAEVVQRLWETTANADTIITTGVGQHQMWVAQYYRFGQPYRLVTSGGLGTMGFGLPAGVGAAIAHPDKEVWVVEGDGGFQMTQAEMATAVQEGLNLKIVILNNNYLGMVRQWQELFYERRYSAVLLHNPDFVKLADAHGIPARRVTQRREVDAALAFARQQRGPVLLEFRVPPEDNVFPMVTTSDPLHRMMRRPDQEPHVERTANWAGAAP